MSGHGADPLTAFSGSRFRLDFQRVHGCPKLQGLIRRLPEDFRVFEELGFEPGGGGEHVYLKIRKTGANSAWVGAAIARHAAVRKRDVGYAGRKDRHAVTEQWFSCWLPGRMGPDWRVLELPGVEILNITRAGKKLKRGSHLGNRFDIIVRNLRGMDVDAVQDLQARLCRIRDEGFPNYFGQQRFGKTGSNLVRADELLAGGDPNRGERDRERDIYLSAARSYIFNRILETHVQAGSWRDCRAGGRAASGPLMGVSRVEDSAEARLIRCCCSDLLHWCEALKALGLKAGRRALWIRPGELTWQLEGDDLRLSFSLHRGAYATALLRELVDVEAPA